MEMLQLNEAQLGAWVGGLLWPLFRIASFLMIAPIFGTQLVPTRVRLAMAFGLAVLVAPLLGPMPEVESLSLNALVITLQQVLIGSSLGFMVMMLMQLFVVSGQMIAMQMGLGFASMMDPANGVSVPVVSQFFLVGTTLLFLAMNGHLVMLEVLVESFYAWPVSTSVFNDGGFSASILWDMVHHISWLFAAAMLIALPVVTAVLIVNIAFGVMTRAAPQMNIFSLGFPVGLIFGLFIIWASAQELLPQFLSLSEETFVFLRELEGR